MGFNSLRLMVKYELIYNFDSKSLLKYVNTSFVLLSTITSISVSKVALQYQEKQKKDDFC